MLAVLGDLHLGRSLFGFDLTPFIRGTMYRFFHYCRAKDALAAVVLGDIYDRPRPSIELEKIVMQWAQEFNRAQIRLYLMAGNHDVISKAGLISALDVIKAANLEYVHIMDRPIRCSCAGVPLVFAPFPSPSTEELWQSQLEAACADPEFVAFTHLNVEGAKLGDQEWIYRGGDHDLPDLLQEHAEMIVNGHIHKQQRVGNVHMLGAAQRLRFSERNNRCSFGWLPDPGKLLKTDHEGIKLRQIEIDVSAWGNNGEPMRTADAIKAIEAEDVDSAIVKGRSRDGDLQRRRASCAACYAYLDEEEARAEDESRNRCRRAARSCKGLHPLADHG